MFNENNFKEFYERIKLDKNRSSMIDRYNRVVAVSPHPDDMEIVAGGLIRSFTKKGKEVYLIVVSDGRKGSLKKEDEDSLARTRMEEQLCSANVLGVKEVHFLNYVDSEVPEPRTLRKIILPAIRKFRPDLIITVDPFLPYEAHLDHVYTGKAVMESVLLFEHEGIEKGYEGGKRPDILLGGTAFPNVIVDVSAYYNDKMKAIACHKSQIDSSEYVLKPLEDLGGAFGKFIGAAYGEPFRHLYGYEMHLNTLVSL